MESHLGWEFKGYKITIYIDIYYFEVYKVEICKFFVFIDSKAAGKAWKQEK